MTGLKSHGQLCSLTQIVLSMSIWYSHCNQAKLIQWNGNCHTKDQPFHWLRNVIKQVACHLAFCGCCDIVQYHGIERSGRCRGIDIASYQYRNSHCGDTMIWWLSYLHNGISYPGKVTSLYRNGLKIYLYIQNPMQIMVPIEYSNCSQGELIQWHVHACHYIELNWNLKNSNLILCACYETYIIILAVVSWNILTFFILGCHWHWQVWSPVHLSILYDVKALTL